MLRFGSSHWSGSLSALPAIRISAVVPHFWKCGTLCSGHADVFGADDIRHLFNACRSFLPLWSMVADAAGNTHKAIQARAGRGRRRSRRQVSSSSRAVRREYRRRYSRVLKVGRGDCRKSPNLFVRGPAGVRRRVSGFREAPPRVSAR